MRKTERLTIFPWNKGVDKTSIPGTQDRASLVSCKNILLKNNGARAKGPGITRLEYQAGISDFLRGMIDFHGTVGQGQFQEIIRVVNGRVEALRGNDFIDLSLAVSASDKISFARFVNALIIFFDNTRPQVYTVGGTLSNLAIPSSHVASPPRFGVVHDQRLVYAGRRNNPHILTLSAINSYIDYTLLGGAMSIRVRDGDGDPIGITGLSSTFRGDMFVFKYRSTYRLYNAGVTYGIDLVTDQVGCINHNTIVATQNDVFWVSDRAIHSMKMTANYGAAEEATVTYPIYEFFQDDINWAVSKYMWATYDIYSNSYLLCYASGGSPVNNKILGFNTLTKEFFFWEDRDFACVGQYLDENQKTRTLVGLNDGSLGYFDNAVNTQFSLPVDMEFTSSLIFPKGPSGYVNFTKAKLMVKPTTANVYASFLYRINGTDVETLTVNTYGSGSGNQIGSGAIGSTSIIGPHEDIKIIDLPLKGSGASFQVKMTQEPDAHDADEPCEIYGLEIEFDYQEDTGKEVQI